MPATPDPEKLILEVFTKVAKDFEYCEIRGDEIIIGPDPEDREAHYKIKITVDPVFKDRNTGKWRKFIKPPF